MTAEHETDISIHEIHEFLGPRLTKIFNAMIVAAREKSGATYAQGALIAKASHEHGVPLTKSNVDKLHDKKVIEFLRQVANKQPEHRQLDYLTAAETVSGVIDAALELRVFTPEELTVIAGELRDRFYTEAGLDSSKLNTAVEVSFMNAVIAMADEKKREK